MTKSFWKNRKGNLIHNSLVVFGIVMTLAITATYLVGVSHYETQDFNGVSVTQPILNNYGYLMLLLPLLGVSWWLINKRRRKK